MAAGGDYLWIGPASGDWGSATNWRDTTTGSDPAPIAPGIHDNVSFDSSTSLVQFIDGSGASNALTLNGDNAVLGTLTTGSLVIGAQTPDFGFLQIHAGATLIAGTALLGEGYSIAVSGAGAVLQIGGSAALDGPGQSFAAGGLAATDGAQVRIGDLAIGGYYQTLAVDGSSVIEIGTLGGAASGALTIDPGAILAEANTQSYGPNVIAGQVIDNGLITATGGVAITGTLSGSGTLELKPAGTVTVANVAAGLAIRLDGTADLIVPGGATLAAGVTLGGSGDIIQLGTGSTLGLITGTLAGFDASDVLVTDGTPITDAAFSGGTLSLIDAGATIEKLLLAGNFSGGTFAVNQVSGTLSEIVIAAPPTGSISAGTPGTDAYLWTGPLSGDWGSAGNWRDTTTGSDPATIAPGIHDNVSFDSGTSLVQFIDGSGASNALTLNGDNAVLGTLTTGSLVIGAQTPDFGFLQIHAGATLIAGTALLGEGYSIAVSGAGAVLQIGGSAALDGPGQSFAAGGLAATDGAQVRIGDLAIGGYYQTLAVDGSSVIEIGTLGGAASGALTIDPGAILAEANTQSYGPNVIAGQVIDNGLITATGGVAITGTLSGSGTLELKPAGTVTVANVAAALAIRLDGTADLIVPGGATLAAGVTLGGSGDIIQLGTGSTLGLITGTLAGFDASDVLMTDGTPITDAAFSGGTLSLIDAGATIEKLLLAGDFSQAGFSVHQVSANLSEITTTAACYVRGTRIRTKAGDLPVELLRIGDHLMTAQGIARPIRWIGRRRHAARQVDENPDLRPIVIRAGALADFVPLRDLHVSPLHALHLDDLLIPAALLVNGISIRVADWVGDVEYFHLELATHDIILAEGAPAESFLDDGSRSIFDNAAAHAALYPDHVASPALYCAPRANGGYRVKAIRDRIIARAHGTAPRAMPLRGFVDPLRADRIAGWAQNPRCPDVPVCLDIRLDGSLLAQVLASQFRADLASAGLGRGRHGFCYRPPKDLTQQQQDAVAVRRSSDGARLAPAPAAAHAA